LSSIFEEFFSDIKVECPYGLPETAVFRQAMFGNLTTDVMEFFLASGYRRNGNYIYTMACGDCDACIPIRLEAGKLEPNRGQRRVMRRNRDLEVRISPLGITNEKLAICDKFLQHRFPGKGNAALEYYAGFFVNGLGHTYEIEFWLDERLFGVSVVDIFPNAINCVYFYFDPDFAKRSPGTFNILFLEDFAAKKGISFVYLGYLIEDISAMSYKANFKPHWLLVDGQWQKKEANGRDG